MDYADSEGTEIDIRAVFWDFGGVVTTSPFDNFREYEKAQGLPRDFLRTVNAQNIHDNAWARMERSEISLEEFDTLFRKESMALGHEVSGKAVLGLLSGELRLQIVAMIARIRGQYLQGCLTNNVDMGGDTSDSGMARDADTAAANRRVFEMFDFVQESRIVGVRKPNLEFYKMALETAGVQPQQVVYLDDLGINLKPARKLGMHTIKVVDPDRAMRQLHKYLRLEED